MKFYKSIVTVMLLLLTMIAVTVNAKDRNVKRMYVFGVSTSFNDSTVYFTTIQTLDSVNVAGKTSLLSDKQEYSWQLKDYFNKQGMQNRTCVTVNNKDRKKLEKIYGKLKQKYSKKWKYTVKSLADDDFKYERVVEAQLQ